MTTIRLPWFIFIFSINHSDVLLNRNNLSSSIQDLVFHCKKHNILNQVFL